jgi:hypothetical protein
MSTLAREKLAGRLSMSLRRSARPVVIGPSKQQLYHELSKASAVSNESGMPLFSPTRLVKPERWPKLNIQKQAYKPEYYEAISKILKLREKYQEDRFIFVRGREMIPLLRSLGARDEDFATLPSVTNNLHSDPTLPYRKTKNGRFCFDFGTQTLRRLEFQPFILSENEDFKRYDSGQLRIFDEVEDDLQLNTAFLALFIFKAIIFHGLPIKQRPNLNYTGDQWVCTLFHLRTITTPDRLGEPALEGVHTDGVDHTMTTYLGSENMTSDSAVTFMHDASESTGIQLNEANPGLIKARVQHRGFLDTLMLADHENKHSVTSVHAVDKSKDANRDMLVFFTRKPTTETHVSGSIDSLKPHDRLSMEIPLVVPKGSGFDTGLS